MKKFLLLLFILLVNSTFGQAQEIKPEKTGSYFYNFTKKSEPEPRGEFETKADYEKRTSTTNDPIQSCYFQIGSNSTSIYQSDLQKYKYDIDNEKLTFSAGRFLDQYDRFETKKYAVKDWKKVVLIDEQLEGSDREGTIYYNSNSSTSYSGDYRHLTNNRFFLYLTNSGKLDSLFDTTTGQFKVKITSEPNEAKRLSKAAKIIIKVTPASYKNSFRDLTYYRRPEVDDKGKAYSHATWDALIEASVDRIIVWDTEKNSLIAEYKIDSN